MIASSVSQRGLTPAPSRQVAASLDEAIRLAETSSVHLQVAHEATQDSYVALDGFQPAATDIARDTAYRDVSSSGKALQVKADASTTPAEKASGKQYQALQTLDWATQALDQAMPGLSSSDRQAALLARQQLQQREPLWHADVALGTALATLNGGARPYIDIAAGDRPGQDVSWVGGEVYGNLRDTLGQLNQAGHLNGHSLQDVNSALTILRDLRERNV